MILTLQEVFDFILIWIATGIIFAPFNANRRFLVKFILLTGLSSFLHELFHKISALLLGIPATFHASYLGLTIGLILKFVFPQFIFFIPGYVSIYTSNPLYISITAFAGPLANLLLFFVFKYLYFQKNDVLYYYLAKLNLYLFILNMIPIPPLDGFKVIYGLIKLF